MTQQARQRIYIRVDWIGLTDYYKTDLKGEYGEYPDSVLDKLRVKYALEWDLDKEDVEVSFVLSVPRRDWARMGRVERGDIYDG